MNFDEFFSIFEGCELKEDKIIIQSKLYEVIDFVKNNYSFDILKEIIAIDNQDLGIELIYHLYSTMDEEDLFISFSTNNSEASSIVNIFKSAQADENEIYDLFGIKFTGNNELKRLYMPEDWQGYPLRKNYIQDEMRQVWNDNDNT